MNLLQSLSSRRAWIEILKIAEAVSTLVSSLSSRRAWIEIASRSTSDRDKPLSLSSRRAWIEIGIKSAFIALSLTCRSPHGERGLKFTSKDLHYNKSRSLSSRRAWIEISSANTNVSMLGSLSSRRAWIEIQAYMLHYQDRFVALLTESVD